MTYATLPKWGFPKIRGTFAILIIRILLVIFTIQNSKVLLGRKPHFHSNLAYKKCGLTVTFGSSSTFSKGRLLDFPRPPTTRQTKTEPLVVDTRRR